MRPAPGRRRAARRGATSRRPESAGAVRLRADGQLAIEVGAYPTTRPGPVRLAIDTHPVDPDWLWLHHKTNRREIYQAARARHPDVDDVVLVNHHGRITETTIASIAVRLDGRWWTPPQAAGCLPGVGRAVALARGRLAERDLTIDDLDRCAGIALINSLRGWRPASLFRSLSA